MGGDVYLFVILLRKFLVSCVLRFKFIKGLSKFILYIEIYLSILKF